MNNEIEPLAPSPEVAARAAQAIEDARQVLLLAATNDQRRYYKLTIEREKSRPFVTIVDWTLFLEIEKFDDTIREIISRLHPRRLMIEIKDKYPRNAAADVQTYIAVFDAAALDNEPVQTMVAPPPARMESGVMLGATEVQQKLDEQRARLVAEAEIARLRAVIDEINVARAQEQSRAATELETVQTELADAIARNERLRERIAMWRERAELKREKARLLSDMLNERSPLEGAIKSIEQLVSKPEIQPVVGPVVGRIGNALAGLLERLASGASAAPQLSGEPPAPVDDGRPRFDDPWAYLPAMVFVHLPPEFKLKFLQLALAVDIESRILDDVHAQAYADLRALGADLEAAYAAAKANGWDLPMPEFEKAEPAQSAPESRTAPDINANPAQ